MCIGEQRILTSLLSSYQPVCARQTHPSILLQSRRKWLMVNGDSLLSSRLHRLSSSTSNLLASKQVFSSCSPLRTQFLLILRSALMQNRKAPGVAEKEAQEVSIMVEVGTSIPRSSQHEFIIIPQNAIDSAYSNSCRTSSSGLTP